MSPPARAAKIVADMTGFDHEVKEVDLKKGEHKQEWFLEVNPIG